MSNVTQKVLFRFSDNVGNNQASLTPEALRRLEDAIKPILIFITSNPTVPVFVEFIIGALVLHILPDSATYELGVILEKTASELVENANKRWPRKVEQAVSAPHAIPFLRSIAAGHVNSGLQGELVVDGLCSLLPTPPLAIFTGPKDSTVERLTSTFQVVGVCRDERGQLLAIISGRRFLTLADEHANDLHLLREAAFGNECWFEGTIERIDRQSWKVVKGGPLVMQKAAVLTVPVETSSA